MVTAETYNALVPDGTAVFTLTPSASVDPDLCAESHISVVLDYQAVVAQDCDGNTIPDICDLISGTSADCNNNGIPDSCDIASGDTPDADSNGVPDACEGSDFIRGDGNEDGDKSDDSNGNHRIALEICLFYS